MYTFRGYSLTAFYYHYKYMTYKTIYEIYLLYIYIVFRLKLAKITRLRSNFSCALTRVKGVVHGPVGCPLELS